MFREETSHASVYNCTRIDNSKHILAFSDFPPPQSYPHYCSHRLIIEYLGSYADHFGLRSHVHLNTRVLMCSIVGDKWKVVTAGTASDGKQEEHEFDAVLVCNGHHNIPRIPKEFTGTPFKGTILHSHTFKRSTPFLGKKVVVVGVGNSGVDIACDVAHDAQSTILSTRSGAFVLPKMYKGKPIDFSLSYLSYCLPWSFVHHFLFLSGRPDVILFFFFSVPKLESERCSQIA